MPRLDTLAAKVRSKNAGPFWVTIDIFCGDGAVFDRVRTGLSSERLGRALRVRPERLKRFELPDLAVVKISLPRPAVQGSPGDRDMHGAALGALIGEIAID